MDTVAKKSHEKLLAIIAATVTVGAIIFSTIINPQLKKHKQYLAQVLQLQLKLAKMRGDLLIKDRIDNVYLQIEPLMAAGGTDQHKISLFTRELGELYSNRRVKISSVKILPIVNEKFYKRLLIRVEMSGHIKDILNFITSVESYSKPIKIEELDLKSQDSADNVQAFFLISQVISD